MKPAAATLALFLFATTCRAEPHLPPGTKALPSAERPWTAGAGESESSRARDARVFGGKMPDLFVAGYGGPQALYLFKWADTAETGAPDFAQPVQVECAFKEKGSICERADGAIVGLWIDKEELVTTEFDRKALEFRETKRAKLPPAVKSPVSLGFLTNADGSHDLAFETSNGGKGPEGHPWQEDWRPYNSSAIANGELRYRYLVGWPAKGDVRQITATQNEVFFSMHGITGVNLGSGHGRDLVTGSRQGNLPFYRNKAASRFDLETKRLIAGEDGNALRHPSINPSVCAYPNVQGRRSDLIACGEGSLYFYRFTGQFATNGAPMYATPVSVLQENADLYAGTLPSPTTADWNADGLLDMVVGDITGDCTVYLNRGTKTQPRLDPAHPLYCDGIDLRGMWRCRPAVAQIGGRTALVIVDGADHFRLYWRIDDYNVADGGKLTLNDGKFIGTSGGPGGMSGRCKLDLFDWNQDGQLDFVIGTGRVVSIPDRETGLPMPAIGKKTLGTPLLMLNTGTNERMKFARPVPFKDEAGKIIQPGGAHETGAVGTMLGGDGPNLLICNEAGRLFLLPGKKLRTTP